MLWVARTVKHLASFWAFVWGFTLVMFPTAGPILLVPVVGSVWIACAAWVAEGWFENTEVVNEARARLVDQQ